VRNVARRRTGARDVGLTDGRDVKISLHGGSTVRGHVHHRSQANPDPASQEGRVAVVEQPAVRGAKPVAASGGHCRHGHDGLGQMDRPGRSIELGVAIGDNPAVGGYEQVPLAVRGGAMPTIGLLRWMVPVEP
jgi:hypothetical protein